jgi:circadian clock protein KaiB
MRPEWSARSRPHDIALSSTKKQRVIAPLLLLFPSPHFGASRLWLVATEPVGFVRQPWCAHGEGLDDSPTDTVDGGAVVSDAKSEEQRPATYLLKLYITGGSPRAEAAIANLRRICDQELHGQYELQIIDVLKHPQVAEDDKILATPTLIKQLPPPLRRVIGDLSDKEKVLLGLEVRQRATNSASQRDAP